MTEADIITALQPLFSFLGAKPTSEDWHQYALALADVNPGDLDDAIVDVRKTHAFRNAPLPAEILRRCENARKSRVVASLPSSIMEAEPIQTEDGELRTFTLPGIGSLTIRVLPDDHPALRRYACLDCKDTSWLEGPTTPMGNSSVVRCHCFKNNPVLALERQRRAERNNRK